MKIILLQDIPSLGQKHDVKNVADGYARNFLFPRSLAVAATDALLKQAEEGRARVAKQAEMTLKATQKLVKEIDGYEIEIPVNANEDGTLYAAIGIDEIKEAFAKQKIDLGNARLKTEEPLKEIGEHAVTLHFPHNLEAEIKVVLKREEGANTRR